MEGHMALAGRKEDKLLIGSGMKELQNIVTDNGIKEGEKGLFLFSIPVDRDANKVSTRVGVIHT